MVDLGDWSIQFNYYEDLSKVDVVASCDDALSL